MKSLPIAITRFAEAIVENSREHWILAYSGGKDSSAALKIFFAACEKAGLPEKVTIIYCDTGVENPVLDMYVKNVIGKLSGEFKQNALPVRIEMLKAPVNERFFVRVVGRGYPPPTNSFRWCTKGLRIKPVSRFLDGFDGDPVVVLGLRSGESKQRDRSMSKRAGGNWQRQDGVKGRRLFLPIVDFDLEDVWGAVQFLDFPQSIDGGALEEIYRGASGECPSIKSPRAPPCASGRFGCWTCTVVRRDRSAESLVDWGEQWLKPYIDFRSWLISIRNDPSRRWARRRNGTHGMGPFNLAARREILTRLTELTETVGVEIIDNDERNRIFDLWELDLDAEQLF